MALFNVSVWQRSRFTLQWFIINLVGSLACLTAVALAQFEWSEGVSGSVSIPDVAFTSLGNLAVFLTAFTRGRLDVENGARDVLATTRGPKLNAINGCGLATLPSDNLGHVDVIMLSKYNKRPHSSLTQFMQYISHSHDLESILLQLRPFTCTAETSAQGAAGTSAQGAAEGTAEIQRAAETSAQGAAGTSAQSAAEGTAEIQRAAETSAQGTAEIQRAAETSAQGTAEICKCVTGSDCRCVVFGATKEIMNMLDALLPGTLKRLSESQCLLPSHRCLENKCHGCNQAAGKSSEPRTSEGRLREDNPWVDSPAAFCEALNEYLIEQKENSCICIPVHPGNADRWTKFMIKFLKSKEKEAKGIKVVVSDALQHYITRSAQELGLLFQTLTRCTVVSEIYDSASLILPRVAEVIVNMGLTGWLRLDGFSSSLVARRAIRDYVVDSTGTGFAANAFLTEAVVFCSADRTNACSVLFFRGGILSARRVSYMVGCVNLICSITWSVLIACEGNWAPPSTPLSTRRLAVIIGAVGVALGMDCFEVYGSKVRTLFWAWAEEQAEARARVRVQALETRARGRGEDRVQALELELAKARDQAWVRALELERVQARDQVQVQALEMELAQARVQVQVRALELARAQARDQGQVRAVQLELAQARDQGQVWALELELAQARDQGQVWALELELAQARDQVQVRALELGLAQARDEGQVRALELKLAQAQAWVKALKTRARDWDLDRARDWDLDLDQARALAQALAWAPGMDLDQDQDQAQAQAEAQARTRARARARAQARGWDWGLVAVVILEVGCIVSLVVMFSMKGGPGRWVYSGMQVLVWVKWGIGSFLLGDKATEGEDGSPYFRIRNRGTWVYCSAFLLNAMLAGVRGKWAYSISK